MSICTGKGSNNTHCCWLPGGINNEYGEGVCPFLVKDGVEGRTWACSLRAELGNWELVHMDERYLTTVKPIWDELGVPNCGDWGPGTNQCCYKNAD